MIHHWKAPESEILDGDYQFDRTYTDKTTPSQTSNFKHVEIKKVSDKRSDDTSLESSQLRYHRF